MNLNPAPQTPTKNRNPRPQTPHDELGPKPPAKNLSLPLNMRDFKHTRRTLVCYEDALRVLRLISLSLSRARALCLYTI